MYVLWLRGICSVRFGYTGRVVCRDQPVGVVWANNPASTGIRTKDVNAAYVRDNDLLIFK